MLENRTERFHARRDFSCTSTLHLDGRHRAACAYDKIHLPVSLAPVEEFARARRSRVRQMRADRRFDEPSAEITLRARLLERPSRLRSHERCIQYLELRDRTAAARGGACKLLQAGEHAGAGKQIEIVRERGRIARILQLAEHLRVRKDLSRITAPEFEQAAQERRLVHA